jgi:2,4-dienoyl-CoA reductase-like NADH-dependent reductase (Old Yellow Enzyme family)
MSKLFSPLRIREIEFKNRIFVSPMCQYSAIDGVPTPWHFVHLGSRAVGGAALVMVEASGVSPEGRISPQDTGIWNEKQIKAFSEITKFIIDQNCVPGIQLAHAGRKASTYAPWFGNGKLSEKDGAWEPLAPSAAPFSADYPHPKEMTEEEIKLVTAQFEKATKNSLEAGFKVVEIHSAHGYLLHEFLSPLSNHRKDQYGGSLENRMRFPLSIAKVVRATWPKKWPVFIRISASDWVDGGWNIDESVEFAKELKKLEIDLVDCSSGGTSPDAKIPAGPGYQVPFSEKIHHEAQILTGAVGIITDPEQAEAIIAKDQADVILMAREFLRDPYWPLHAAKKLGVDLPWPKQYERAKR